MNWITATQLALLTIVVIIYGTMIDCSLEKILHQLKKKEKQP